ncbi:MAG: right-handed parallel beta-helix repeat-containing protein [Desulfobacteraceae bacterium]|nr:MAG: right-handed parallel beta-helix repeat-containing protein [Desulfobacteraceae bacterium]
MFDKPCIKKIVVVILVLFLIPAFHVSADFYVISGSHGSGKEIKSLPYTISEPGFYFIRKNLNSGGAGIIVEADHVTIDLMGFVLTGPGAGNNHGVYMNGRSNVEIRNGTVTNFGKYGIYEQSQSSGRDHRILNIRSTLNNGGGIYLYGKSAQIENCTASENLGSGIFAGQASKVTGNTARVNEGDGIYGNGGNLIYNNVCRENVGNGIFAAAGSTVTQNTLYNNAQNGISTGDGCTVTHNTSSFNLMSGIDASSSSWAGSIVSHNTCYDNTNHGIVVGNCVQVRNNTVYYNDFDGISLKYNSFVDGNLAYDNNQSGGSFSNISSCTGCTFGTNLAP